MQETLRVVFAGGGTGGHLFPALNMADVLREKGNCDCLFFGTERGLEKTKVPQAGYPLVMLPVAGIQRRLTMKNLAAPWKLYRSMNISRKKLQAYRPHLVIGTGGYVMGPVLRSAQNMNIPTVLQEQNSYPGLTTRLLSKRATLVLLAYREAALYMYRGQKVVVTGNPVKIPPVTFKKEDVYERFELQPDKKMILVFGGSQGAQSINRAIKDFLKKEKLPPNYQILWQTGKQDYEAVSRFLNREKLDFVKVTPFIERMFEVYSITDFAVCRAGAMTLSELAAAGVPAVLVPYPHAAADHQMKNARALEERKAAVVVKDDFQLTENLTYYLLDLSHDITKKEVMRDNLLSMEAGKGLDRIMAELDRLIGDIRN
jgi:UDP-N-acetylglucosamine--N-acetylmuramyl-(pentapeptide) pyrophosphoryl-undecaprenol N-acetylglucosamine transferase